MRFLHSLRYALFIWLGAVILGSVASAFYFTGSKNSSFFTSFSNDGILEILYLMLLFSAAFSLPALLVVFFTVLVSNPRKKAVHLKLKLGLTALAIVLTTACFLLFVMWVREGTRDFLPTSLIYLSCAVMLIWIYPLTLAAGKRKVMTESHLTIAQLRSGEEKVWFEGGHKNDLPK